MEAEYAAKGAPLPADYEDDIAYCILAPAENAVTTRGDGMISVFFPISTRRLMRHQFTTPEYHVLTWAQDSTFRVTAGSPFSFFIYCLLLLLLFLLLLFLLPMSALFLFYYCVNTN
jgi:hypothetical protein